MTGSSGSNWFDVVRSALWPLTALFALYLFYDPLLAVSSAVSRNAGSAEEVAIGSLRIKFNAANARNIPPPPASVAEALLKLNPIHVDKLLSHDPRVSLRICFEPKEDDNKVYPEGAKDLVRQFQGQVNNYQHFIDVGVAEFDDDLYNENEDFILDLKCGKGYRYVSLTDLGENTRRYLIDVLTSAVTISPQ